MAGGNRRQRGSMGSPISENRPIPHIGRTMRRGVRDIEESGDDGWSCRPDSTRS